MTKDPSDETILLEKFWEQALAIGMQNREELSDWLKTCPEQVRRELAPLIETWSYLSAQSDDSGALSPGEMIGEKFRIKRRLGKGGMGVVYDGHDVVIGRRVAIKIMRDGHTRKIQEEAQILAALDHPAIVKLWGVQEIADGRMCAVMEFVDSGNGQAQTLTDLLNLERKALPPGVSELPTDDWDESICFERAVWAAELMLPVAKGLADAHISNVIHRDIKPSNLFIKARPDGDEPGRFQLLIGDWGLGKSGVDGPQPNSVMGTLKYVAPECVDGRKLVDHRCDIYSFGVTLYETARLCLPASSSVADTRRRLHPHFDKICDRCLEQSPSDRFASMRDVIDELERFCEGRESQIKVRRFRPTVWSSALAIATVIAITFAVVMLSRRSPSSRSSHSADRHRELAIENYNRSEFEAAAQELQVLVISDTANSADYEQLARIRESQERYDEALAASETALEQASSLSGEVLHARLLTYHGRWEPALEKLDQLVARYPDDPLPLQERCEVNGYSQQWAHCARDFLKLKSVSPARNHARCGYLVACEALGDTDRYLAALREFAQINRRYGDANDMLGPGIEFGMCPILTDAEYQDMLRYFDATDFASGYFGSLIRGQLHYRRGETEHAISLFQQSSRMQNHGGTPIDHSFLALCFIRKSEFEEAKEHIALARRAHRRLCGSAARPLAVKTPRLESGQPTQWHKVRRFERAIAEAEAELSAAIEI